MVDSILETNSGQISKKNEKKTLESYNNNFTSTVPIPWRRFWARGIDNVVGSTILISIFEYFNITFSLSSKFSIIIYNSFFTTIVLFACFIIEAAITASSGTTLGKWLLNIKVYSSYSQKNLSFSSALKRNLILFIKGCGLYFSFFFIIAAIYSFFQVGNNKNLYGRGSWDKSAHAVLVHSKLSTWKVIIAVLIILVNAYYSFIM